MADLLCKDGREFTHQLLGQNYPPSHFPLSRRWLLCAVLHQNFIRIFHIKRE